MRTDELRAAAIQAYEGARKVESARRMAKEALSEDAVTQRTIESIRSILGVDIEGTDLVVDKEARIRLEANLDGVLLARRPCDMCNEEDVLPVYTTADLGKFILSECGDYHLCDVRLEEDI